MYWTKVLTYTLVFMRHATNRWFITKRLLAPRRRMILNTTAAVIGFQVATMQASTTALLTAVEVVLPL